MLNRGGFLASLSNGWHPCHLSR